MMATPQSRQPASVAAAVTFTGTKGPVHRPLLPSTPAPAPAAQTTYPIATDSVSFTLAPYKSITLTFPNLPNRSTANPRNMLQAQQTQLGIAVGNTLHFAVALQGVTGTPPTVTPQAVDIKNVRIPGPFFGGGSSYKTFQAVVTAGPAACSGTAVGSLDLMIGGST